VVLAYHRVSDERDSPLCVPPAAFRAQLELLLAWGLRPGSLEQAGPGHFVLTIDDGYEDGYTEALPILSRLGVPAVFYVCTGYLDGPRGPGLPAPDGLADGARFLTWAQAGELTDAGHVVASHSVSHRELPGLADAELAGELTGSKAALESGLRRPVKDFCYPRGRHDQRVRAAVAAAGYERAVVTPSRGRVPPGRLAIERAGIYRHDSPWRFRAKVLGLHRLARRLVRP
jgi:peptidoglycan/xylan/chitin deacetylase (PgdA/CDA1 family)